MKQIIKTEKGPYIRETRTRFTGVFRFLLLSLAAVAAGIVFSSIFLSLQTKSEEAKETAITQALADITGSIAARYAHMMLQTVPLRQGDCFVCSADGFPPNESIKDGKLDSTFPHYKMLAYVIFERKPENTTLPLNITLPAVGDGKPERIQLEAEIEPLTKHLYTAEFFFPREKMPVGDVLYSMIWIQCGTGREYRYTVYSSPGIAAPAILMNESVLREEE